VGAHPRVLPAVQKKFADTYRAAGGDCRYELFVNSGLTT
jgi:hypothetical protein